MIEKGIGYQKHEVLVMEIFDQSQFPYCPWYSFVLNHGASSDGKIKGRPMSVMSVMFVTSELCSHSYMATKRERRKARASPMSVVWGQSELALVV